LTGDADGREWYTERGHVEEPVEFCLGTVNDCTFPRTWFVKYKINSPCRCKSFECLRSASITAASHAGRLAFEYGAALKRPAILVDFICSFSQALLTDTLIRNRSTFFLIYFA
jgi:hypothetical protein